jgi:indole-3-glycerol phosphate synthase
MNILETIIAKKQAEVAAEKEAGYLQSLGNKTFPKLSLKTALEKSTTGIIAEFKRKSPSKGWIYPDADVTVIPAAYEQVGATGLSILTDESFFGGSLNDLQAARPSVNIPILRKDFIVDPYQLHVAKALGANVILLIAAALEKKDCASLAKEAKELELEVLLEIHEEPELEYISPDIDIVGINNRNLKTFVTDVETSFKLGEKIPAGLVKISESGISDPHTIKELRNAGFNGFLIGETFMKEDNPALALNHFIKALN